MLAILLEKIFIIEQSIQRGKNGANSESVAKSLFTELSQWLETHRSMFYKEEDLLNLLTKLTKEDVPLKYRVFLIVVSYASVPFTNYDVCSCLRKVSPNAVINAVTTAYHLTMFDRYGILVKFIKGGKGRSTPNVYKLIRSE